MSEEEIRDVLDTVVLAARRYKAAQIDAAACGTGTDFDAMHRAESEFENVYDKALRRFVKLAAEVRGGRE